jgi:FG-GAP repeat
MKSKILVLGFALISVFAVAQSNNKTDSAKKSSDKAPAAAAAQPSLKVTPEKVEAGSETIKKVSDVVPTKAKPSAADDWQAKRVAAGDVNGDGKADVAPSSSSDVKAPRDIATGQASGKRQHQPVSLKKEDEQKPPSEKK